MHASYCVGHMTPKKLHTNIAVALALVLVGIFFTMGSPVQIFSLASSAGETASAPEGQLIAQDEVEGRGATAAVGDTVRVHYTGRLENGTVFDTSLGKQPYAFVLGRGDVIPGWELGIAGMKVGGKRVLIVPSDLAYGRAGFNTIPPYATLIFNVELVGVEKASATTLPPASIAQ